MREVFMNKDTTQAQNKTSIASKPTIQTGSLNTKKDIDATSKEKPQCFDELKIDKNHYRPVAQSVGNWLDNINSDALNHLNEQAENIFYRKGVTFTVYSDAENIERLILSRVSLLSVNGSRLRRVVSSVSLL